MMSGPRRALVNRQLSRGLGVLCLLAGGAILLWLGLETLDRRAAQHRGRVELLEEAPAPEPEAVPEPAAEPPPPGPAPAPEPGSTVARIVAPRAGVDVVAFEGIDAATLKRGAGHIPGTALPGQAGNSSFAAHRDSFFRGLRHIEPGDEVYVESGGSKYVYRVADLRVVEPSQVEVVASRGRDELTLVTCYPFDYVGPAPRRFVVHADLLRHRPAPGGLDDRISP